MEIGLEPIIYLVTFVTVVLLVQGLYLAVFGKSMAMNKKFNRRLEMLNKGARREDVMDKLRRESDQHRAGRKIPLYSLLSEKARKGNVAFTPLQLIGIMIAMMGVVFVALTIGTGAAFGLRVGLAVFMGIGAVYFWVNSQAKKRLEQLEEQLPDAVELMVRSLRVGHPFSSALAQVCAEIRDPLASELGIISDEAAFGRDMGDSLKDMAERLEMQDLRFLAVAVSIQQTSGGNLAEILDGLAKVIRARFRLFRRVKAITSEARFAGTFLSAFPLIALVAINVLDPHYYDEAIEHPWFIPACLVVAVFLVLNLVVMKALVNIKV